MRLASGNRHQQDLSLIKSRFPLLTLVVFTGFTSVSWTSEDAGWLPLA